MEDNKNVQKKDENRVWIGDDKIIYVDIVKADKEEDIIGLLDNLIEVVKGFSGNARILINIITTQIISSPQFRKKVGEKFKDLEKLYFKRTAMCGGNIVTRTIANFIISAAGLKNIKVFVAREEAIKWLKEI